MEPSNQEFIDTPNLDIQAGMQIDPPTAITPEDKNNKQKKTKIITMIFGLFAIIVTIVIIIFFDSMFGSLLSTPGEKETIATAEIMAKEYILEKYNLSIDYTKIEAKTGGHGLPSGSNSGLVVISYNDFSLICNTIEEYCKDNKDSNKIIDDYENAVETEIAKSFSDESYYFETTSQRTSKATWEIFLPNNITYNNDIYDSVNLTKIINYTGSAALSTFIYIKAGSLDATYTNNIDNVVANISEINKDINIVAWLYSESQPMNDYAQWLKNNQNLDTCEYDNSCASGGDVKKFDEFNEANYLYLSTNN